MKAPQSLAEMQKLFLKRIVDNDQSNKLEDSIVKGPTLSALKALEVYRTDYEARMANALGDRYKAVWRILGDDEFFNIAAEFVNQSPSTTYDLGRYGNDFPSFLSDHAICEEFPFLSELAMLENAFLRLFHAQVEPSVSQDELQNITDPMSVKLQLSELIYLYQSPFQLYQLFELRNIEEESVEEFDIAKTQQAILYKSTEGIRIKYLNNGQLFLLKNLIKEKAISLAIEKTLEQKHSLEENDISQLFQTMALSGLIIKIESSN